MKFRLPLIIIFSLLSVLSFAQRGKDGNKTVAAANTIVNEYTSLTADATAGATSLQVAASGLNTNSRFSATLSPGDLIMIIQVQGASIQTNVQTREWGKILSYNNCGLYEFAEVLSVPNSTTINIECALVNNYTSAGRTEVVRVPRYLTLTLNSPGVLTGDTWNGTIGGICTVEVTGNTVINTGAKFDMSGKGFRGGAENDNNSVNGIGEYYYPGNSYGSEKGEGIAGYQLDYDALGGRYCRGAAANGGGGANAHNHGGGGGANAGDTSTWTGQGNPDITTNANYITAWNLELGNFAYTTSSGGGRGGYSFSVNDLNALVVGPWNTNGNLQTWGGDFRRSWGGLGGRPLDYSTGRIFFGGGGGTGDQNDGYGTAGANGGGVVFIQSYGTITGSGQILSNGTTAANSSSGTGIFGSGGADGAGGGGAGGTIIIKTVGPANGITTLANGGNGGNQVIANLYNTQQTQAEGPGGGGGGGYIALSNGSILSAANGGLNGTTNSSGMTEFPPNGATKGGAGINNAIASAFYILAPNDTICSGTSATLTATLIGVAPTGTVINWYDALVGGNIIGTGPTFTTPVLITTTTYYVGTCPGTYHQPVIVYINTATADAGPNASICLGGSTNLNATGGTSYVWSPSVGLSNIHIANPVASPATTTTYYVTVTNSSGCTAMDSVKVTVNGVINASAGNDVSICPGASTNLLASGGVTYAWSPAGSLSASNVANPIATPVSTTSYIVTVTNASSCTAADTVVVTVYPVVVANAGNDTTICTASTAQLHATGGVSYIWSPTGTLSNSTIANPIASPLTTTTYLVTVTDAHGCTGTDAVIVTVASNLNITVTPNAPTICASGSIQLTASGGNTYSWAPAGTLSSTTGTTVTASPTVNTTYTVTATSATGCTGSTTVTVTIGSNLSPSVTPSAPSICVGGSVQLTASGGTNYTWSPAGGLSATSGATVTANPTTTTTYLVTATDAGGCSGTTSVIVSIGTSLTASVTPSAPTICPGGSVQLIASGGSTYTWSPTGGLSSTTGDTVTANPTVNTTYMVTVSDGGGCSGTASVVVSIGTNLNVTVSPNTASLCPGTSVQLTASGATNYSWSPNAGLSTATGAIVIANPTTTTSYTVIGTDGSGCSGTATVAVTVNSISAVASSTNENCGMANGTLTVVPTGTCTQGFTYAWNTVPQQTLQTATNVAAGVYTVTVSCGACSTTATTTVGNTAGPTASITNSSNSSCGMSNGQATVTATGGTSPYTYLWSNAQDTQILSNVAAGAYTVTVQDASGCSASTNVTIGQATGLVASASSTSTDCNQANGTATVFASQGSGNYTYSWSTNPAQTTSTATGLAAGTYMVTVNDGPCSAVATVTVPSSPGPTANFIAYPTVLTVGSGTVYFNDNSSGSVVSWVWNFGDGSPSVSGQATTHIFNNVGTFYVELSVTDNNGCISNYYDSIVVHEIYTYYIPNTFTPNGDDLNDVFLPQGLSVDPNNFEMAIYDRWGTLVFISTTPGEGWNGTYMNKGKYEKDSVMGVYVYRIRLKDLAGYEHNYIGHVNLIP